MRQLLPLVGTAGLMAGAGWVVSQALAQEPVPIMILSASGVPSTQQAQAQATRLAPSPRSDVYFNLITERPLFEPTRRPFLPVVAEPVVEEDVEPAPVPIVPVQVPPPDAALLGVMTGGARNAALVSLQGDDPNWLSEGDDLQGWNLGEITPGFIILEREGRRHRVELYER